MYLLQSSPHPSPTADGPLLQRANVEYEVVIAIETLIVSSDPDSDHTLLELPPS